MPRGGCHKRKRNWNIKCPLFPEERPLKSRRAALRTVGAVTSLSESWRRCGEGFQDMAGPPPLTTEMMTVTEKHLELSPGPKKETTTFKNTSELTEITWSSSGSDLSDEDKTLPKSQRDNGHGYRIDSFRNRNILCPEEGTSEDELQSIDWEVDSNKEDADDCDECKDDEGTVDISDCASCASTHSLISEGLAELPKPVSTEILEYSSDSDKDDDLEDVPFIDSESPHKYHTDFASDVREVVYRPVNPEVKLTEPVLCTPQKQTAKFPRTPENSAKKKKLLRGGLAERLTGLHNRERSAISLWRHQCVSYQKTLSDRKSGVLIVKILELHEECTLQVAICEQLAGPPAAGPSQGVVPKPGASLKVLFTRETAGHLRGQPQDVIHIFPPWQKLIMPNGSFPVILNTYFCQKVVAKGNSETTGEVHHWDLPLPRRNISLAQIFRIEDLTHNSESQVVCGGPTGASWTHRHEEAEQFLPAATPLRDSLLDMVESQGVAPWSGVGVRVVVQRVYSLPSRHGAKDLQGSGSGLEGPPGVRVCFLVQDAYGMFGEVHLEGATLKDPQLEGKSCSLVGMKALQKATRGRTPGLFSLIDTLWPPVMSLKASGHAQSCEEVKTCLPPPAFCYILSASPNLGRINMMEEGSISKLYQPPVLRCLRDILQTPDLGARCSFYARVIYQRPQLKSLLLLEQREIWLLVTDVTLQSKDGSNCHLPKSLPVCVAPSCVLGPEVLGALASAAPHSLFFKDVLRDQGQMVCVERSVLLLQKPLQHVASGADSCVLTGPVTLDELNSLTPVHSICSVQGAVVGVDESTAFSWPVCNRCGNGRLEQRPEDGGAFSCGDCSQVVTSPVVKRHLQVFLDCPSRPQCCVKVKLLQDSISSLLRSAACEDGGYDVKSILGKEVGLFSCFVHSVATHPTCCIGLEEVELLGTLGSRAQGQPLPLDL